MGAVNACLVEGFCTYLGLHAFLRRRYKLPPTFGLPPGIDDFLGEIGIAVGGVSCFLNTECMEPGAPCSIARRLRAAKSSFAFHFLAVHFLCFYCASHQ